MNRKAGGSSCSPTLLPGVLGPRSPSHGLTFLVGLVDGLDFSIGPSSEDFDESLFICAGSLECQGEEHRNHSPDVRAEAGMLRETTQEVNAQATKPSWIFSPYPDTAPTPQALAQSGANMPACQDFQNLPQKLLLFFLNAFIAF